MRFTTLGLLPMTTAPMPAPPMIRNSVTWASTRTFPPCMVKPASTLPKTMMKPMTVNTAWQLPHP